MKLFERGKIGKLTIKNRIMMAPMGMGPIADVDSCFSQRLIDHYVARAKGGTGLIITGCSWAGSCTSYSTARDAGGSVCPHPVFQP